MTVGDLRGNEGPSFCSSYLIPTYHLRLSGVRQEKAAGIGCVLPGLTASLGNQHTDTPSHSCHLGLREAK